MNNISTIQFFLKESQKESDVLDFLSQLLGLPIESINYEKPNAPGFAQISEHLYGFQQGFLISWHSEICKPPSIDVVGKQLAITLKTNVLIENQESVDEDYLFAKPDGTLQMIPVVFTDDGIDIE